MTWGLEDGQWWLAVGCNRLGLGIYRGVIELESVRKTRGVVIVIWNEER